MGRPIKHFDGYTTRTIILPNFALPYWERTKELALRENTSISSLVLKALDEYLLLNFPFTKQPPLEIAKSQKLMKEYITDRAISRLERTLTLVNSKLSAFDKNKFIDNSLNYAYKIKDPPEKLIVLMEKVIAVSKVINGNPNSPMET